jgi:site-specific DNA recombinase
MAGRSTPQDETVVIAVPPLLDAKTIRDIRERMVARRTYLHGCPKHPYLLSGRIFCAACGMNLTGQLVTSSNGVNYSYYKHSATGAKKCSCRPLPNVPAARIEEEVVGKLFDCFGNPAQIKRAIEAAVPNSDEAIKRRQRFQDDLASVKKSRQNVLALVASGVVSMEDAQTQLGGLKDRESVLTAEIDRLDEALANVPSEDDLKCYVQQIEDNIFVYDDEGNMRPGGNDVGTYITMTWEDKKRLIDAVFSGAVVDGKPAGVYVKMGESKPFRPKEWQFVIKGRIDFELVMQNVNHSTRAFAAGRDPDQRNPNRSRRPSSGHRSECRRGL